MQTITITIADDGRIVVESEGQEPYTCNSSEECMEYLEGVIGGEANGEEAMWNEEADKRSQPGLMA